jgi:hypothetical protein
VLALSPVPYCLPVSLTPSALSNLAISELINFRDTQPTCAPFQRFKCGLCVAPPSHGSGSGWFATPFLHDSFIHYSTPVYPDAIQAKGLLHKTCKCFCINVE